MDLGVSFANIRASPVYVPVFVFRSTHFGNKLRTFVSGANHSLLHVPQVAEPSRKDAKNISSRSAQTESRDYQFFAVNVQAYHEAWSQAPGRWTRQGSAL